MGVMERRVLCLLAGGAALATAKLQSAASFKRAYDGCNARQGRCICFERQSNEAGKQLFVDCSNLGLTEVPADLPEKTNYLFLNGNDIQHIGAAAFMTRSNSTMGNLRKLHLHNNRRLQKIDDGALRGMVMLKTILLHYTNLTHVSEGMFGRLPSLRTLWFHHAHVTHISPYAFSNLTRLEYLTLNTNHIASITGKHAIRWPSSLDDLNLMDNPFTLNETNTACCAFCGVPSKAGVDAPNAFAGSKLRCGCDNDEELVCNDACSFDGSKCHSWILSPAASLRARLGFSVACMVGVAFALLFG